MAIKGAFGIIEAINKDKDEVSLYKKQIIFRSLILGCLTEPLEGFSEI